VNPQVLNIFVVYQKPKDFPDEWVVRRWEYNEPKEIVFRSPEGLGAVREWVKKQHPDLYRIPRDASDDRTIVESWI